MRHTHCLIVDDEPLAHEVLLRYMAELDFLKNAGQCYQATQALPLLSSQRVDLMFLDIEMPKLNGLDLIKSLTHPPLIIITSAYPTYALESFDLEVCDYLLKPFRFERFLKAVTRAQTQLELRWQLSTAESKLAPIPDSEPRFIYLKSDRKRVKVILDEVFYLESLGNYVKVWGSQKFLLTPRTLLSFEEQLPSDCFLRIHKSFIVNKKFIHYIEDHSVYLTNGSRIPIGKHFRPLFMNDLG